MAKTTKHTLWSRMLGSSRAETQIVLNREIDGWKNQPVRPQRLSDSARRSILNSVGQPQTGHQLMALFFPAQRLALAGALPVLFLGLLIGSLLHAPGEVAPSSQGDVVLTVGKEGGDVVFWIANGQATHRVYKSDVPSQFTSQPAVVPNRAAYRDRLISRRDLVFYRID